MKTQKQYRAMLDESWRVAVDEAEPGLTRLAWLGDTIFDFTTYDDDMASFFASKALEVCDAISSRTTFRYIENPAGYLWFLLMCNMPFFLGRLGWGTSIRGAWWEIGRHSDASRLESCGLYENGKQVPLLQFTTDEWRNFIAAIIAFANEKVVAQ